MQFIHLHNHTDYSVLDGAITVDRLVERARQLGMPGIAMTDHGNMFGAIDFYQKAMDAGIKPIIGQEFYVAPGSRFTKEAAKGTGDDKGYHLLLLAENRTGYQNLMKLSSIGYLEGFYYKPRIDREVLEKYHEGLICSSACLAGEIPVHILRGEMDRARETARWFRDLFGPDRFYLELQDHGIPEQKKVNRALVELAGELEIPLVATNDAHYVEREDAYSHDVLLCIQTGKTLQDEKRMRFHSDQFYLKSTDEMYQLFAEVPDALYNSYRIFEMIDLQLELGKPILPHFEVPEGFNLDSYLRHLVYQGAEKRYGKDLTDDVKKRIEYELSVITSMQFSGYFLIVWDFINHSRSRGIPVGPGRGSAAGSIVSYCLGITNLDPLRYDLLFERFLNPDRNEMPDMDIDFCADRREEVIDYVREKYGADHVSQIITYGKMKAKAVVKDVARVMEIPFATANDITDLVTEKNLELSLKNRDLQDAISKHNVPDDLLDIALRLEGLTRSAGKHAAGVVIAPGPITDYVPLYRDPREGSISSQYEMKTLERAGLVKMDFLGLKNLTIIDRCLGLIQESTGDRIDIDEIPLDDQETYRLLQKADTKGVFQLESSGMQNIIRRLGPTTFEDIIAIVALYRPGPLNSGMTDDFIKRKRNPELVSYPHSMLEPILKDTMGVIVYQEQVMLISREIAGFSLPEADKLRKAMGKKKMEIIDELEEKFIQGARERGIEEDLAVDLYNNIKKFGEYGFNKSHSAAYALVTYQTAYLKAHYPVPYYAALLSASLDKQEDVIQYINDARSNGIQVMAPSINDSFYDFTIENNGIRFGLGAIKGMGEKAIESIIRERREGGPFNELYDFITRIDLSVLNRGVLEALVMSGALDVLHGNRAELFASIDTMLDDARHLQQDRISGQGNLFGGDMNGGTPEKVDLVSCEEWSDLEKLSREKQVLGLYLSGHPLSRYAGEIRLYSSKTIPDLDEDDIGTERTFVGMLHNVQVRRAQKNGRRYAVATLEDLEGTIDAMVFHRILDKNEELILSGKPLMITGRVEGDEGQPTKILTSSVKSLQEARRESVSSLHIRLDPIGLDESILETLRNVFVRYSGDCPIYFHIDEKEGEKIIKAHSTYNIAPSDKLVKDLSEIIGQDAVRYSLGRY
jgi:DNA polymerase-3 subunit alpha